MQQLPSGSGVKDLESRIRFHLPTSPVVIVVFESPCPPCQFTTHLIETHLLPRFSPDVPPALLRIDANSCPDIVSHLSIIAVPSYVVFEGGIRKTLGQLILPPSTPPPFQGSSESSSCGSDGQRSPEGGGATSGNGGDDDNDFSVSDEFVLSSRAGPDSEDGRFVVGGDDSNDDDDGFIDFGSVDDGHANIDVDDSDDDDGFVDLGSVDDIDHIDDDDSDDFVDFDAPPPHDQQSEDDFVDDDDDDFVDFDAPGGGGGGGKGGITNLADDDDDNDFWNEMGDDDDGVVVVIKGAGGGEGMVGSDSDSDSDGGLIYSDDDDDDEVVVEEEVMILPSTGITTAGTSSHHISRTSTSGSAQLGINHLTIRTRLEAWLQMVKNLGRAYKRSKKTANFRPFLKLLSTRLFVEYFAFKLEQQKEQEEQEEQDDDGEFTTTAEDDLEEALEGVSDALRKKLTFDANERKLRILVKDALEFANYAVLVRPQGEFFFGVIGDSFDVKLHQPKNDRSQFESEEDLLGGFVVEAVHVGYRCGEDVFVRAGVVVGSDPDPDPPPSPPVQTEETTITTDEDGD